MFGAAGFVMKLADEIREFVRVTYIEPARRRGESTVTVRAGDVHKAMGPSNRLPAVVAALVALKFESHANVRRKSIDGPLAGAKTVLTFELL